MSNKEKGHEKPNVEYFEANTLKMERILGYFMAPWKPMLPGYWKDFEESFRVMKKTIDEHK